MIESLTVWWLLVDAERAFRAGQRELGWQRLQAAEQLIPTLEGDFPFREAQKHADDVWSVATGGSVLVHRSRQVVA